MLINRTYRTYNNDYPALWYRHENEVTTTTTTAATAFDLYYEITLSGKDPVAGEGD